MKTRREYMKPAVQVVWLKMQHCLLGGSFTEIESDAEEMEEGSFDSRSTNDLWDDDDELY